MFKVIAVYYHKKAFEESENVLVHFCEDEPSACSWVCSYYNIDWRESYKFIEEHITFEQSSLVECLNLLLEQKRGYDGKQSAL